MSIKATLVAICEYWEGLREREARSNPWGDYKIYTLGVKW